MRNSALLMSDDHVYTLDGVAIPSQSEIISECFPISTDVPEGIMERARNIGTAVHQTLEYHDKGTLDEKTIPTVAEQPFVAYKSFLSDYSPKILEVESAFYGQDSDYDKMLWACTIDRVFEIDNCLWVIDLKTGGKYRTHRLQTANNMMAYNSCDNESCVTRRGSLYLSKDGKYSLHEHKEQVDFEAFISCLKVFYFKHPRYSSKKVEVWD